MIYDRANTTEKSENSFDDILPDSRGIVDVLLGQGQGNIGRVILPFLRLLGVQDTEPEPPRNAQDGVGNEVGRGKRVALQLGRLDLRVDGSEVCRLPSNGTTVLLLHGITATKDNGLGAFLFVHSDLVRLGQKHCSGKPQEAKEKLTENKEHEEAQRPLPMMATFLGSNNPSAGALMEKGWHSWPSF